MSPGHITITQTHQQKLNSVPTTLAAVPIMQDDQTMDLGRIWVRDAIVALRGRRGRVWEPRVTEWTIIEQNANNYIRQKG